MPSETRKPTLVPCPTCGQAVKWDQTSPWRPFCSRRCQLIDLNEWLSDDEDDNTPPTGGSPRHIS